MPFAIHFPIFTLTCHDFRFACAVFFFFAKEHQLISIDKRKKEQTKDLFKR